MLKEQIKQKYPSLVLFSHKLRGILAHYLYLMPSRKLKVIGITGTNGKTTTCYLTSSILEQAGYKVGMASTTSFKVGSKEWTNSTNMTTMSPFALQSLLSRMAKEKCQYAVVETSSHAIAQFRNWGIKYYAVAMTNVTHEHLDYHKTFEKYVRTKTKLFQSKPKVAVANMDDANWEHFLRFKAGSRLTYSQTNKADITARKVLPSTEGSIFTLVTPQNQQTIELHLPGLFNISNALCAASICYGLGIKPDAIKAGIEHVQSVPGRMEKVEQGQDFTVLIDYAVTPDSLEKLYSTLREGVKGKMIAVLGSCGDRDKTKRPIMGAIAGRYNDYVIVTDEEPYTENPSDIIEQVAKGVPRGRDDGKAQLGKEYFKILDRRKGIAQALSLAKRGDLVVITGMGAQEFRVVGSKKYPWNESQVIKEELLKLGYNKKDE